MISSKMIQLTKGNSTIRAMFEEGKRLTRIYGEENVFDFSIGNPNVEPPEKIKEIIKDILDNDSPISVHGYMNNSGYEEVRDAIGTHLSKKHNVKLGRENIIMTCGAAGGLNILFKTLLNPDDEVIVFAPFFGEYINYVQNYNGKVIVIPADSTTFYPDLEKFRAAITEKTKAVIVNSPNNPSGVIYSDQILKSIGGVLADKEAEFNSSIYLISDEPYREIVYDNAKVPFMLKYHKNSFIGYSYSKSLSLPGERIGYIVVNPEMNDFELILSSLNIANRILGFVNAPSLFQKVIAKALDLEVDITIYKNNRDVLFNHLTSIGIECNKPEGAFYLFPKSPMENDVEFCNLAKKYNILAVPGSVFGMPGYFRLSYCIAPQKVLNSLEAFTKLMKEIK